MCCRLVLTPVPADVIELLGMAGFQPIGVTLQAWKKELEDGLVWVVRYKQALEFSVQPAIASMNHHERVRVAGAFMFKLADIMAQSCNGMLTHKSNIDMCAAERGGSTSILASYPEMPFRYEKLCLGFRNIFGKEAGEAA